VAGVCVLGKVHPARSFARVLLALAAASVVVGTVCERAAASDRYRVRPGDTLTAIAAEHHTSIAILARLNKLDPNRILPAGSVLRLPQPRQRERLTPYVVRLGDTLSGIAFSNGLTVTEIARLNHLDPAELLVAGRRLMLPAGPTKHTIRASIRHWADHYRIPRSLALALAWQESGHQAHVISEAGAVGVMQVMPRTWTYVETVLVGRPVSHTPDGNVRIGLAYLRHLLNTFGNTQRALAAYLQGEYSVQAEGIYRSSRRYVANILAIARQLRDGTAPL
jgi:LysM repeat protein